MNKVFILIFTLLICSTSLFSQDSTRIFIQPEFAGDYTKFVFSFDNHNQNSVKRLILQIDNDEVTFEDASVSGEASSRGWIAMIDTSDYKTLYFLGDDTFYSGETCGEFKFELAGQKSSGHIKWTTKDSLNGDMKNDSLRFAYATVDTCKSAWVYNNERSRSYVSSGDFITTGGFTWEVWMKYIQGINFQTSNGYYEIIASVDIETQGGANPECYLGFGHASLPKRNLVFSLDGTLQNSIDYYPANGWDSQWHHLAVTHHNDGQVDLYIDGIRVATKMLPAAGTVPQTVGGIDFGSWYDHSNSEVNYSLYGYLDEIRFWHSSKSLVEINQNMNDCLTESPTLPTDLYAYYPILICDYFPTGGVYPDYIFVDHSVLGTHDSEYPSDIGYTSYTTPELRCCGGSEPCLCDNDLGSNYDIPNAPVSITGWAPNMVDDCCWEVELEVACDMNITNRIWVDIPAAVTVSGMMAPANWIVDINQPPSGFSLSFPDGFLPAGNHTLKMCFEEPVNPSSFTAQVRLLDYYDDNNFTEICDKDSFNIACLPLCDCDSVYIADIVEYETNDPDHQCCYDVTIHAECDNYDIDHLLFDYDWNESVGVALISSSQTWHQHYGNFDNDDDYLAAGDHVFRVCLGTDMSANSTSFLLRYLAIDSVDVCPEDSLEFICGGGCDCDSVYISDITEYISNDPDHQCCYDVTIHAECDNYDIDHLLFDYDWNESVGVALISSPQTWHQHYGNFDNDDDYLAVGDHVFRVCLGTDMAANSTSFLLRYLDTDSLDVCPVDSLEFICDTTSCTCDEVYIADIIEFQSNDPDHKCCYEIVLRAECRKDGISILDFLDDPNDHLSFSLVSSPQNFTQNFNTYTNQDGYLEAGDHVFRVCLSRFSPNDYASFMLMYLDDNASITCPPDTIDIECGDDCCSDFDINVRYDIGANKNPIVRTSCKMDKYFWVRLNAGPLPISRVALHLVKANREVLIDSMGTINEYTIPLDAYFMATSTNYTSHQKHVMGNPNYIPDPWVWNIDPNKPAHLNVNPPFLKLDYINSSGNLSLDELIWGDFVSYPNTDISSSSVAVNYKLRFKEVTCHWQNMPFGNIISDSIIYQIRYYVTNSSCCTCDTLVTSKVKVIEQPIGGTGGVVLFMKTLTEGNLVINTDLLNLREDEEITQISFEPDSPVKITSMKDKETGKTADIVGNVARMSYDGTLTPKGYIDNQINVINSSGKYMFGGTAKIYTEFDIDGKTKGERSETFRLLGQVPYEGEGDKITKLANPLDRKYETITLLLANLNIYEKEIASIKLHAEHEDIEFEAVGKPIKTDSSIVISMVEHRGDTYIVNDFDKSMRFFADTLRPNFWDLAPEKSVEPIVVTYSFPEDMSGQIWSISYVTYSEEGIKLSEGTIDIQIPTGVSIGGGGSNGSYKLLNCYPNPADGTVNFQFELFNYSSNVNLTITDVAGIVRAKILEQKSFGKGTHIVVFSSEGLQSGNYFYTLEIDGKKQTKPLVIVK